MKKYELLCRNNDEGKTVCRISITKNKRGGGNTTSIHILSGDGDLCATCVHDVPDEQAYADNEYMSIQLDLTKEDIDSLISILKLNRPAFDFRKLS